MTVLQVTRGMTRYVAGEAWTHWLVAHKTTPLMGALATTNYSETMALMSCAVDQETIP